MDEITDNTPAAVKAKAPTVDPREVACGRCDGRGHLSSPPWSDPTEVAAGEVERQYTCPQCSGAGTLTVH